MAEIPATERRSSFEDMSRDSQAMQRDDLANPGMLWVVEGEVAWSSKAGSAGRSCADCHGNAAASVRGAATQYPTFSVERGRPIDLQGRINLCCETKQNAHSPTLQVSGGARPDRVCGKPVARHADRVG